MAVHHACVRMTIPGRVASRLLAVLALTAPAAGCDLPRDPEGSLEKIRGAELVVGVSEAPPWVERGAGQPEGIEADIVRRFARELDADVRWEWLPAEDQVGKLTRFEIHLAVGRHTRDSPLAREVGATRPWYVSLERRGGTDVATRHHVFLVPPGENAWLMWLEGRLAADSGYIHRRVRMAADSAAVR